MKVNLLNAYKNNYTSNLENELSKNGVALQKNNLKKEASKEKIESKEILTTKERNFFKQMFPENSAQIEKHILFNRNGKLQTVQISKGMIFDGKF